jgi:ketol-acid reductoisomerase
MAECEAGKPHFKQLESAGEAHQIEVVGARLREMMPWLKGNKLVDKARN